MAWQVYYGDTLIGDPRLELPMVDKELEISLNQTGRFEFTLLLGHPMLGKLELYQKLHEVRVVQDGEEVFRGRVMEAEESFDKSIRYTCEGDRGYLNDALLPSYEVGVDTPSTYAGFFNWVISKYNDSMQENARFSVGLNQAEELGEMPAKKSEGHPKAWEELKSTVVEAGGYVRTRHEAYARVIDLLVEGDKTSSQRIRFGENLLDYSRRTGGADYCTRCCATGGTPSKGQATSTSGAGDQAKVAWLDQDAEGNADWSLYKGVAVTVKFEHGNSHANPTLSVQNTGAYPVTDWDGSSPDGKDWTENETRSFWFDGSHWVMDYDSSKNSEQVTLQVLADRGLLNGYRLEDGWVVNFEAEKKYGVIEGIYENSDQMFPEQLLQEALRWLVNVKVGNTIEMTALDLHNVDPDVSPIRVGDYVRATSRPHGFDEYFICTSRKYDLDHPENDEFTLGSEYDTLTASQSRRLAELNAGINSAVDQVDIATALAGSKSAIFSEQPAVYKANDLWVQAPADESGTFNIMVATADSDGTFKASDWERASDYTNDAAVLRLQAVYAQYVEAAEGRFDNLETNSLTAESATIKNLEADTAKVHDLTADNLSAATGYIADLKSKNVTTDNINAATGYIGSLTSNDITAQKLTADSAYIDALTANDVTASDLTATNAYIENLKADNVSAQNLSAASGYIATLTSNDVTAQNLTADHGYIGTLTSNNITANDIVSDHAEIGSLDANYAHITEGVIDNATIGHADVDGLNANYAHIANGSIDNATIDQAKVNNLSSNYAHITNGVIDNATIGYADVDNLSAHYAEITNGHINSALIDTAAIVDEQVFTVTGNKATISEINADTITVRNLHTSNLTVDTADGYVTIGNKKTPTKEYIDSLKDELQQEIDGAVETWTSAAVPLMSNYPTTQWALDPDDYDTQAEYEEAQRKAYAKHVGDICYVQQQGSDYDGFCYRFSYSNGDFSWVLIKDSSVTKALGEISDLQTFESETTSWIDETEEGLTTIRNNHTALSGVVDKTVKSSTQLWYTKANTTAPTKPTARVTSTATTGNGWRTVVPAWNASYPNYYYCWQFELADGTYAWSDVVRDIAMGESQGTSRDAQATADANIKSSVQLWFTKANSTAPAKPTAQVTTNNPATGNAWNLAVPTYSASYPHYFYCYQQQKGDGTYQWSDVVYDKGTTEAMQKAQAALPSSTFTTFQTTTFKTLVDEVDEQSSTIATMSETMQYGGANLLPNTGSADGYFASTVPSGDHLSEADDGGACYTRTLSGTGNGIAASSDVAREDLKQGVKYTMTLMVKSTAARSFALQLRKNSDKTDGGSYWTTAAIDVPANTWTKLEGTITAGSADQSVYARLYYAAGTACTIYVRNWQLERGEIATEWSPSALDLHEVSNTVNSVKQTATSNSASITSLTKTVSDNKTSIENRASSIEQDLSGFKTTVSGTYATKTALGQETTARQTAISQLDSAIALRATKTETYQSAQPNLAPMFSSHNADGTYPDGGTGGYWQPSADKNYRRTFFTALEDGWMHVEAADDSQKEFVPARVDGLAANDRVTMLVEWRNASWTGSGAAFYSRNYPASVQLPANWTAPVNTASGEARHTYTVSTADGTAAWNGLINWTFLAASSSTWTGDIRISFYKEVYDSSTSSYVQYAGPYKPYSGSQLYASQAELKVANDNISLKVNTNGVIGAINLSSETAKIAAGKVEIDGTAVFNSISSKVDGAITAKGYATTSQAQGYANTAKTDALKALEQATNLLQDTDVNTWTKVNGPADRYFSDSGHSTTTSTFVSLTDPPETGLKYAVQVVGSGTVARTASYRAVCFYGRDIPMGEGQEYTMSWWARCTSGEAYTYAQIGSGPYFYASSILETSSKWRCYTAVFKYYPEAMAGSNGCRIYFGASFPDNTAGTLQLCGFKLVAGNALPESGGTNLFLDSESMSSWRKASACAVADGVATFAGTDANWNSDLASPKMDASSLDGQTSYVVSFDYKSTADCLLAPVIAGTAQPVDSDSWSRTKYIFWHNSITLPSTGGEWKRYSLSPRAIDPTQLTSGSGNIVSWYMQFYARSNVTLQMRHIQMEAGNSPSAWKPAPEDHAAYVDNLKIGGTNLLRHTDTLEDTGWWTHDKNTSVAAGQSDPDGGTGAVLVTPETTAWYLSAKKETALLKDVGEEYTASVWLRADTQTTCKICVRYLQSDYADGTTATATTRMTVTVPTTWTKFSVTGTLTTAQTADSFWVGQSTTVPMYVYHPKVEKGAKATDWSASPEDIVAKSQRIYYRTSATTKPTAPTTWVTEKGDKWAANATTAANWTTKVTSIANGTGASVTKYLYLYTCVQTVSGTGVLTNSEVLLDDSTTVIDGGKIITGSVTANQIDVGSIAIGNLSGGSTVVSNATNGNTAYNRHTAYRGTCSTAAGTAAKVAACTGFALASGATVEVYCSTANTANVPTLNVNSTGAKPIWINGAVASASNPCKWKAGDTVTFTYNTVDVSTGVFRASLPVENYITADSSGIKIHDAANTTNYQHQTSSGTAIYVAGKKRTETTSTGLEVFDADGTTSLAKFGTTARVGKDSEGNIVVSSDSIDFNDGTSTLMTMETYSGDNNSTIGSAISMDMTSETGVSKQLYAGHNDSAVTDYLGLAATGGTARNAEVQLYVMNRSGYGRLSVNSSNGLKYDGIGTANRVFASPSTSGGTEASFRALVASDIPNLAASKITSGTLATARGGTGADGSSVAINRVLASPGSGSAGAVSYRALVAADIPALAASKVTSGTFDAARIPNLNTSKLTAGTLGVARGGTGAATFAADSLLMTGTTATGAFRALSPDDYGPLYFSDDEEFVFGTLPVGYGGTGKSGGAFHSCTQLYNSTSGSNGTITLSSSVANFDYLAIWTVDNNGANPQISWVATRKANTTSTVLHVEVSANTTTYFRRARYAISGTSMTPSLGNYIQNQAPATWTSGTAGTNYVKVTRVMGYVI